MHAGMENAEGAHAQAQPDGVRRSGRRADKPVRYREVAPERAVAGRTPMKKTPAKAQTIPDVAVAFEAIAVDTATALDSETEVSPEEKAVRLDALITAMQAALEQHGPREVVVRQDLRFRMRGMALSAADKAAIEACAVAADGHGEAVSAARRLSAELDVEWKLCAQRSDALASVREEIDAFQDEIMRAPQDEKPEMSAYLREMMREADDLQLREREGQIFVAVTEIKLNEAHNQRISARTGIHELMASVPRSVRQKGVAACLLGNMWAA